MKVSIVLITVQASLALAFPTFFFSDWNKHQQLLQQELSIQEGGNEDRLIKLSPNEFKIIKEAEKMKLRRSNINFIDITEQISIEQAYEQGIITKPSKSNWFLPDLNLIGAKQLSQIKKVPEYKYPTEVKHDEKVKKLYESINIDLVYDNLSNFTSFFTRYYKSKSGFESSKWLFQQLSTLIEPVVEKGVTVKPFNHKSWDQFSIIVSIPGQVSEKVVIGAHQDSINLLFPSLLSAPGADDDGSGTVTILESLRILLAAYESGDFQPYNTLEFHWYSAEEGGLLGSIDVFSSYAANHEVVVGMLQQDMTGYTATTIDQGIEPHFGLITDYTSANLNQFIKLIIDHYNSIPYHESSCGYACSDHSSALENGYPSAFLIESEMKYTSKFIHSVMDTIDRIDWDHVTEHIKLTVAFAYELSLADKL
ncbi:hypothetical protein DFJ63DRAFT_289599 [Scheffersomyces coipomensis]|uniref:uncharacterized protein n=1 Tax=Scheffersomyces coipomensis TaxID=1788519 RepID=UPI00315CC7FA